MVSVEWLEMWGEVGRAERRNGCEGNQFTAWGEVSGDRDNRGSRSE